jgi:hypothetical protein
MMYVNPHFCGTQLQDPNFLRQLIMSSIALSRLTAANLTAAGSVTTAGGQTLPVTTQAGGWSGCICLMWSNLLSWESLQLFGWLAEVP